MIVSTLTVVAGPFFSRLGWDFLQRFLYLSVSIIQVNIYCPHSFCMVGFIHTKIIVIHPIFERIRPMVMAGLGLSLIYFGDFVG